jgi:hypothetical protein
MERLNTSLPRCGDTPYLPFEDYSFVASLTILAAAWLKSSRCAFFFFGAGWRAFFSSLSACRCALSALVRFSDMWTVSHRPERDARAEDFKLHRYQKSAPVDNREAEGYGGS